MVDTLAHHVFGKETSVKGAARAAAAGAVHALSVGRSTVPHAAYVLIAFGLFAPAWIQGGGAWIGTGADARIDLWYLGWVAHAISHLQNPLVTEAIHAPGNVNLMWNASVLLPATLLAPLTLIAGAAAAYNVLVIGAIGASASAAYLAIQRLTSRGPAWIGGAIYGFSPLMMGAAYGQTHLLCAWLPPVTLMLFHDALVGLRRSPTRSGLLLGLVCGLQVLIAEEILVITVVGACVGLAVAGLQHRDAVRSAAPRLCRIGWAAAAAFIVVAALPLTVQLLGPARPTGALVPGDLMSADVAGLVVPMPSRLLHPSFLVGSTQALQSVPEATDDYVGIPLLLLLTAFAVRQFRDSRVRLAVTVGGVMAVLSFGSHLRRDTAVTPIALPGGILEGLPFMGSLVPARLFLVTWLAVAVLVAIAFDRWRSLPERRRRAFGMAALLLALLPIVPTVPVAATSDDTPAFFRSGAMSHIAPGATVLIAPMYANFGSSAMTWQEAAGFRFRIVDGNAFSDQPEISGRVDALKEDLADIETDSNWHDVVDRADRSRLLDALSREKADYVVVGPCFAQEHLNRFFVSLLGPATFDGGGVLLWKLNS